MSNDHRREIVAAAEHLLSLVVTDKGTELPDTPEARLAAAKAILALATSPLVDLNRLADAAESIAASLAKLAEHPSLPANAKVTP